MFYDVSALILTYNPCFEKLIYTLNSFLLQKGVKLQIVISDDGSKVDYFNKIEEYFKKHLFYDYKIVKNLINKGTVKNFASGLKECNGEYIKALSPGDYMNGQFALYESVNFMKRNKYVGIGTDYLCCEFINSKIIKINSQIRPRLYNLKGNDFAINYLFSSDNFLGASLLVRKDLVDKYYPYIIDRIKYSEECYFRIMVWMNERVGYYNKDMIMYELNTGISSSKEKKWIKFCHDDICEINNILNNIDNKNHCLKKYLKWRLDMQNSNRIMQIFSLFKSIRMLCLRIKIELNHRYCKNNLNKQWLSEIYNYEKLCSK